MIIRFFLLFFLLLHGSCSHNVSNTVFHQEINRGKKFIIHGSQSRIIYEYWQKYLHATNKDQCIHHFKKNTIIWKKNPQVLNALQINFQQFCKVHNLSVD
ncbi:hypothetical protein [Candidatus Uabimicrobium sp. HlEnr_7]|uniref:hypothetical protein n=1 Tax=Candidatus Uabimicrobium helgolandensis TaxID=3095367 RepID=UPI003558F39D